MNKEGEDATHASASGEVKEEVGPDLPVNKVEQLMTVSHSWAGPQRLGQASHTIAHLVHLPAEAVDLACAGTMPREVVFLDVDFKIPVFA